jgi:hypothetical protein
MWKLVKAELSYLKYGILVSCAFFIGISLINRWAINSPHDSIIFLLQLLPRIIIVHLAVNFAMLYLEIMEKRPKRLLELPVSIVT